MKKLLTFACTIAVGVALSSNSFADITRDDGAGGAIPDNDPAGLVTTITIDESETIEDVDVILTDANHVWVGDLIVQLTSPSGTTADIMVRTGGGLGDTSDLGGTYTFSDGGDDWWAAADAVGGGVVIDPMSTAPDGSYAASDVNGDQVSLAALFAGEDTSGVWSLLISDNESDSEGTSGGWGLFITSSAAVIPEPGSLAVLGLMGVACVIRRKR